MIPLWLTITCSIILLIVIFYNILTSDIDWEIVMAVVKVVAITIITTICVAVVTISICQWISC